MKQDLMKSFWNYFIVIVLRVSIGALIGIFIFKISLFLENSSFFQVLLFSIPFAVFQTLFGELKIRGLLSISLILLFTFILLKNNWVSTKVKNILLWING